ncbi:hypothetical protein FIBSPDRAFT_962388 [Athelia psychrophila]|uniref:Uncharacterized protein n=1 Tax=Athelia psychrophila TaxID=1759441 RepID=A0A166A672_9AGAM|nr:hypothetical protein FIBSPDRAFT_962388 [Fibularhizoctonia sp. CBS 109695]
MCSVNDLQHTPVNFVTCIKVKGCYLIKSLAASSGINFTKKVDRFMLAMEASRSVCLAGMILHVGNYTAPIGLGYPTFGRDWKPMPNEEPSTGKNPSPRKFGPSRFQDTSCASPQKDNHVAGPMKKPWEDVPIYDGTRLKEADFHKVRSKLRKLPVMNEETPPQLLRHGWL